MGFTEKVGFDLFRQKSWSTKISSKKMRPLTGIAFVLIFMLLTGCATLTSAKLDTKTSQTEFTPTPTGAPVDILSKFYRDTSATKEEAELVRPTQQQLDFIHYRHPAGLFEMKVPSSWLLGQDDVSARLENPGQYARIEFRVANTGYALEEATLLRFIEARESNLFGGYDSYLETSNRFDPDSGSWIIQKEFSLGGIPSVAQTAYYPSGKIVFIIDGWSSQANFDENKTVFQSIVDSIDFYKTEAAKLDVLAATDYFPFQNDHLSMKVPVDWDHKQTQGETASVDTFTSPDEHALVQVIVYDDGETVTKSVAGDFVLILLRDHYTKDVTVTSDILLADGRERLSWISPSGNFRGTTYFETRGTAILVLTEMAENSHRELNQDQVEYIVGSYQVKP